jgi:hypothetical protein
MQLKNNLKEALETANHFELEELEERLEFGQWSAEPTVKMDGTYLNCGGGDCSGALKVEAGVKIKF